MLPSNITGKLGGFLCLILKSRVCCVRLSGIVCAVSIRFLIRCGVNAPSINKYDAFFQMRNRRDFSVCLRLLLRQCSAGCSRRRRCSAVGYNASGISLICSKSSSGTRKARLSVSPSSWPVPPVSCKMW